MAVKIDWVDPASPAEKLGLAPGDVLVSIDGQDIRDGLDYEFYAAGANPVLVVEKEGARHTLQAQKEEYQPLGCGFSSYLIDRQHACKNKCVFCFVDQLPRGLRKSLYFKDDDERLGFLFGNYITLTNLSEQEVQRIITMRFSPVNVSVHTANPRLRVEMMGNKQAGQALDILPRLAAAGITLNCQLVLCPGINDGEELVYSLDWLAGLGDSVASIAAVPVGLTRHREGLAPLQSYDRQGAARQLDILLQKGEEFSQRLGRRLAYPSDEWFLLAGRPIPPEEFYDGYPQLENGVGMWRLLYEEYTAALQDLHFAQTAPQADLAVGMLAAPLLQQLADLTRAQYPKAHLAVHPVVNDFFGPGVTVTGLLTGQDIVAQLQGKLISRRLLLSEDVLRAGEEVFLDGMTVQDLERQLDTQVQIVPRSGEDLLRQFFEG